MTCLPTFCQPSHSYNKTSYPTRRRACGGRRQVRPKYLGLDLLNYVNGSRVRMSTGKRPGRLCRTVWSFSAAGNHFRVFNNRMTLSAVYHLLVFTTAGNINMSNELMCKHSPQTFTMVIACVWACDASLQCWLNRRKFHSPQTQLNRWRNAPFRLESAIWYRQIIAKAIVLQNYWLRVL